MDDPIVGPNAPVRLRRACERNRLAEHFLIEAYESLVALVTPDERHGISDRRITIEEESSGEHARASEACGVGHG